MADLLWHLPTGIIDRRQVKRVSDLTDGGIATVLLKVSGSFCDALHALGGRSGAVGRAGGG